MLKRILFFFTAFALFVFFFAFPLSADVVGTAIGDADGALPESVREYGLSAEDTSEFLELKNVFSLLLKAVGAAFGNALAPFGLTVALLVALYILGAICRDRNDALMKTLCTVAVFGTAATAFFPVFDTSSSLKSAVDDVCAFGQSLFPVLLSCVCASGKTAAASAASVSAGALFSSLSFVGTELVVPLVNTFFAVGVSSSVLSNGSLYSLSKTLKKICVSVLGVCSLIFSLVMGAQQLLASSADATSVRAAAYAVGNGIPVVGGSIGESMSAVMASAEAIAKNVGVFGCVAVVCILFSPLVTVGVLWLLSSVSGAIAEMLGLDRMRRFFSVICDAYAIVAALAASIGVLVIISLGLVI